VAQGQRCHSFVGPASFTFPALTTCCSWRSNLRFACGRVGYAVPWAWGKVRPAIPERDGLRGQDLPQPKVLRYRAVFSADLLTALLNVIRKHHYLVAVPGNINHAAIVWPGAAFDGYDGPGRDMQGYSLFANHF